MNLRAAAMGPGAPDRAVISGGLSARVDPRAPLWPFLLVSSLVHLLLLLLGQDLVRPGSGAGGLLGLEPGPGFERAWPGAAGLPPGMRLGFIDLIDSEEARIRIDPSPSAVTPPALEPVTVTPPTETIPEPVPSPAEATPPDPTTPTSTGGAGDPAGSSSQTPGGGAAGGDAGAGGGGEAGGGGGGSGEGEGPSNEIFVRGRDTLPVIQSMTLPDYPEEAKGRSRVPVVLEVHVTSDGRVDEVRVAEPSGCPACERAAVASAWKLRFTPGTRAGQPVPMWVRYPVTFGRK